MRNSVGCILSLMHGGIGTGAIRLRQARKTSLAQIVNRIITTGVVFASIPLTIAILGREEYGVWLIMLSLITWFSMSDLGLPSALLNPLAGALGQHDAKTVRELISTTTLLLTALGLLMGLVGVGLVLILPMERILGMSLTTFNAEVRGAFVIVIVCNIVALQLRLSTVIPLAMQKGYWAAVVDTLAELVVLAGLILLRFTGGSLTAFALVMSLPMAAGRLLLWVFICSRFGADFVPRVRDWSTAVVRRVGSHGLAFFVGSLGELLVLQTPNIIIAQALGAVAVPLFAIPYQLFYSAYVFLNTIATPMWPAYAEAKAIGDYAWIRRTHWRITRESMILAVAGFSILGALSQWFITLWAGPEYVPQIGFTLILIVHFIQWTWNYVFIVLLTGLGFIRERTILILVFGCFDVIVSVVLVRYLGLYGVPIGMFATMLLTLTWSTSWIVYRKARWIYSTRLVSSI